MGDIARILGQAAGLIGRLTLVLPEVFWQRRRAITAFDRELWRCGVPPAARQVLVDRYREALPLNPLPYIHASSKSHAGSFRSPGRPATAARTAGR